MTTQQPGGLVYADGSPIPPEALAPARTAMSRSFTNGGVRSRLRPGSRAPMASGRGHRDARTIETLIRDCQHLLRNDPIAKAIVASLVVSVVGADPALEARSADKDWNTSTEARFKEWCTLHADVTGQTTLAGLAGQIVEEWASDGATLVHRVKRGEDAGMKVGIELIEAMRLKNPSGQQDNDEWHGGVKLNNGVPLGYQVHNWNETGTALVVGAGEFKDTAVATLINRPGGARSGVYRTEPGLASSVDRFEKLQQAETSTLEAYTKAAMLALLVQRDLAEGVGLERMAARQRVTTGDAVSEQDAIDRGVMGPGMAVEMMPGEKIEQIKSQYPTTAFDQMLWTQLQSLCASMDTCVELAFFKLDKNWANSRAAIAVAWERIKLYQNHLIAKFLSPVYHMWLRAEINSGRIGYVDGWDRHEWYLPSRPVLDTKTEYEANLIGLSSGQVTHKRVLRMLGYGDREAFIEQFKIEAKDNAEAGLSYGNPKQTTRSEQVPGEPDPYELEPVDASDTKDGARDD